MAGPQISVVICTYNRADSLRGALESVYLQETGGSFSFEIIVVDDGSTDGTHALVKDLMDHAPVPLWLVETEPECRGVPCARNKGVASACGEWVAFFDDDQLADPYWLRELFKVAETSGARCIGGAIHAGLPAEHETEYGAVSRALLGEHHLYGPPRPFEGSQLPSTGNLLVHQSVFAAVGGMDVTAHSGEDTEFLQRVRDACIPIWSAPAAVVTHLIPAYRLEERYFRWVSMRWGMQFAALDSKCHGFLCLFVKGVGRLAKTLFADLPGLLAARLRHHTARIRDLKCHLWRTIGYERKALQLCLPGLLPQREFMEGLDFRNERTLFSGHNSDPRGGA